MNSPASWAMRSTMASPRVRSPLKVATPKATWPPAWAPAPLRRATTFRTPPRRPSSSARLRTSLSPRAIRSTSAPLPNRPARWSSADRPKPATYSTRVCPKTSCRPKCRACSTAWRQSRRSLRLIRPMPRLPTEPTTSATSSTSRAAVQARTTSLWTTPPSPMRSAKTASSRFTKTTTRRSSSM